MGTSFYTAILRMHEGSGLPPRALIFFFFLWVLYRDYFLLANTISSITLNYWYAVPSALQK